MPNTLRNLAALSASRRDRYSRMPFATTATSYASPNDHPLASSTSDPPRDYPEKDDGFHSSSGFYGYRSARRPSGRYDREDKARFVPAVKADRGLPVGRPQWSTGHRDLPPYATARAPPRLGDWNEQQRGPAMDKRELFASDIWEKPQSRLHLAISPPSTLPALSMLLKRAADADDDATHLRKRPRLPSPPSVTLASTLSDHRDSVNPWRQDIFNSHPPTRLPHLHTSTIDPIGHQHNDAPEYRWETIQQNRRSQRTIAEPLSRRIISSRQPQSMRQQNSLSPPVCKTYTSMEASTMFRSCDTRQSPERSSLSNRLPFEGDHYEVHGTRQLSYDSPELSGPPVTVCNSPPSNSVEIVKSNRDQADSDDVECVIKAAADLVDERSPTKRESITKLLLKSKDFLKAKSLVRNRNNEIDWVATFLNVGFESNSIYSLMCPLRKGRWKAEEEKYTMELLHLIENGTIRLRHGQSIRGFIAKKLHSDDMRVLKKLSNCKMFHFARMINPRMSSEEEIDMNVPGAVQNLERLEKLKAEFLRSVQLEALVAVRKYLSDSSIRELLNSRE